MESPPIVPGGLGSFERKEDIPPTPESMSSTVHHTEVIPRPPMPVAESHVLPEPHVQPAAADTITGQWRAVPGGYASTATTTTAASMEDEKVPSRFFGGIGPEAMLGKWRLAKSVNFDEYLKALGVNIVKRNMMDMEDYCVHFERVGQETFKMTTKTSLKKIELTFKLDDQEVEEYTDDGRRVLTKMSWDNGVLTQKRYAQTEGEKGGVVVRTFKGDHMELIAQVDDVICKRYYKWDENCM